MEIMTRKENVQKEWEGKQNKKAETAKETETLRDEDFLVCTRMCHDIRSHRQTHVCVEMKSAKWKETG